MGRSINPAPGTAKETIRGFILISASSQSQTATISTVPLSKARLRMLGFRSTGASGAVGTDFPTLDLTNSTTITAFRQSAVSGQPIMVSWEMDILY
jgi:hypothetical protein